ncbi:MAG: PAS domain S-box protein [Rhodospirillaceae bacterium]|nr:PAS domain S-box protein [Rhodospirillaceae bacterium]
MDDRRRKSLDRKTKSQLIDEIEMLRRRLDELDAASEYSPGARFEAEGFAGLGTWTWDIVNNKSYTSSEHYRILGVEPAGQSINLAEFLELVHPDDREAVAQSHEESIRTGKPYFMEHRILWPGGEERLIRERGTVELDRDGKAVVMHGVTQDITEQKRMENALQSSEARFRSIFENTTVGVSITDKNFNYVSTNKAYQKMLGYSARELLDMRWVDITHPDDLEASKRGVVEWPGDGHEDRTIVKRFRHKDGRTIWARLNMTYHFNEGADEPLHAAIVEDISERRQAEMEAERLREAIDNASQGFVFYDADDRLVFSNKKNIELHPEIADLLVPGALRDEIRHAYYSSGAVPEAVGRADEYLSEHSRSQLLSGGPVELRRADGSWLRVEDHELADGGIVAMRTDITDLKQREADLRESEAELQSIYDTAAVGIALTSVDGKLPRTNVAFQQMLGRSAAELREIPFADITYAEDIDKDIQQFRAVLAGQLPGYQLDKRFLHADGSVVWTRMNVTGLRAEDGSIGATIATVENITERRKVEAQLHQAQKMEAIGQLTGGVAHDFNNLLTVISGNLWLIGDMDNLPDGLSELTGRALQAVERGAGLTQRLLAFSRSQTLSPSVVDLNKLIEGMRDMLSRTLGEHIDIRVHKGADLWPSRVDVNQLENVILNLAINARDAMPQAGTVIFRTSNIKVGYQRIMRERGIAAGDYVLMTVSDTGAGMSAEVLERAFEPFFSTKAADKGTGLGLSMIYGFAKQSGGDVTIHSELGAGTTVELYLPRSHGAAEQIPQSADDNYDNAYPPAKGERILVVEDNPDVRLLTVAVLRKLGYEVLEAEDADSALALFAGNAAIDLLLSDVVLPGEMNGPALAREVLRQNPDIKILHMTGYAEGAFDNDLSSEPEVAVLSKPYKKKDLANAVRNALDGVATI